MEWKAFLLVTWWSQSLALVRGFPPVFHFTGVYYLTSHSADSAHSDGDMDAPTPAPYSASHVRLSDGATQRGGFPSPR